MTGVADALDYVLSLEQHGIKLGLENIRRLCAVLDDPHQTFPSVIIAGTNGKGSVAAMVESGVDTFLEVGPGSVLTNLGRRAFPTARFLSTSDAEGVEKVLATLEGGL